ncbi:hypothetical protein C1645_827966 [Glomus cerebriforme]|uniref:Uncharacterized protein n=1 Tax=Glomus cerebriforme TaxID=658196 RepID=A0A397SMP7_9GLOM|nr:hypothetical protein C1645_827966 [Glomus cerebriforme]
MDRDVNRAQEIFLYALLDRTICMHIQPRDPSSLLKIEEGLKNYYVTEYLKEIGLLNKKDLNYDYPIKSFQRSHSQKSNNSVRFDKIEEGLNETRNASYFKSFTPINFQNTPPDSDNNEDNSDPGSEFGNINVSAIKALGWKADKPFNFTIKDNFKHITNLLGWYTDVPVTLKDKEDKMVTVIRNFVHIDNDLDNGNKLGDTPANYYPPSRTDLEEQLSYTKKDCEDDFDKSKNKNEKFSNRVHQLGEEIRQLHSEKNELILQITRKDISLADAESKFSIKSEKMIEELEQDLFLAQEELSEMESLQSRAENLEQDVSLAWEKLSEMGSLRHK